MLSRISSPRCGGFSIGPTRSPLSLLISECPFSVSGSRSGPRRRQRPRHSRSGIPRASCRIRERSIGPPDFLSRDAAGSQARRRCADGTLLAAGTGCVEAVAPSPRAAEPDHPAHAADCRNAIAKKCRHRQLPEPQRFYKPIHGCPLPIGRLASPLPYTDTPGRTSLAKRSMTRCISAMSDVMMSNTMWLTPQIGVPRDIVLDGGERPAVGPGVVGKDDGAAERDGYVLRIAARPAGFIAQPRHRVLHLVGRQIGGRAQECRSD